VLALCALVTLGTIYHFAHAASGYEALTPGPAIALAPRISITTTAGAPALHPDADFAHHQFDLLTVRATPLSYASLLADWLSPTRSREIVPVPSIEPAPETGPTPTEQMTASQQTAEALAWRLTMRNTHTPPPHMTIDVGGVEGPSGGLMFTLALIDALEPGDLTAHLRVTGTGTIDAQGAVGAIGGVALKVQAALAARAQVFFVDPVDARAALLAAPRSLQVVSVANVTDALAWLCAHGATGVVCSRLSASR
jgi:PDZ domain-containing protein